MQAYRITHKRSGDIYYLLAKSALEALEHLTLTLGNVEGSQAWEVKPDTPPYQIRRGVVLGRDGKVVKTLEA